MLIVEGADCLGKTTLCKRLIQDLHTIGIPATYSHLGKLPECWNYPASYKRLIRPCVVQDRFHMSEVAYREARGEDPRLTPWGYQLIDGWLRAVGAVIVVVLAHDFVMHSRWHSNTLPQSHTYKQVHAANAKFWEMTKEKHALGYPGYYADFDYVFTSNTDNEYPSNHEPTIKRIVLDYASRQRAIAAIAKQVETAL